MDVVGSNMKSKRQGKRGKKAIKVVYISSPMKVKTSASKFRALVQELTGKDSDAARFMDSSPAEHHQIQNNLEIPDEIGVVHYDDHHRLTSMVPLMDSYQVSPPSSSTGSDSIFEPYDGFFPSMEGTFMGMLQSNFFPESSQLGAI